MNNSKNSLRGDILSYIAVCTLVGLIFIMFFKGSDIPSGIKDLLLVLAGTLVGIVKDVYAYEFNTTRSSSVKDETIATMSKGQNNDVPR